MTNDFLKNSANIREEFGSHLYKWNKPKVSIAVNWILQVKKYQPLLQKNPSNCPTPEFWGEKNQITNMYHTVRNRPKLLQKEMPVKGEEFKL